MGLLIITLLDKHIWTPIFKRSILFYITLLWFSVFGHSFSWIVVWTRYWDIAESLWVIAWKSRSVDIMLWLQEDHGTIGTVLFFLGKSTPLCECDCWSSMAALMFLICWEIWEFVIITNGDVTLIIFSASERNRIQMVQLVHKHQDVVRTLLKTSGDCIIQ